MSGHKLSPVALGLSLGILWGLSLLVLGLVAYHYSYGQPAVAAIASLYIGYEPSIKGSLIGGLIGFIDAFITGFIVAWLYNRFVCSPSCCKNEKDKCE